jgi:hypothetical protein
VFEGRSYYRKEEEKKKRRQRASMNGISVMASFKVLCL